MKSLLQRFWAALPATWRWIIAGALAVLLIMALYALGSWWSGRQYNKARAEYQKNEDAWKVERTTLIANAEAKEKRIGELEPQVLAYKAAADSGKKVDEELAKKIEKISTDAAAEEAATNEPAECGTRAERTCAKLKGLKPPIVIDCEVYKKKICSQ